MTKPINLRRARKAKKRAVKEITATQNRIKFGRNKTECKQTTLNANLQSNKLDGHKLDKD